MKDNNSTERKLPQETGMHQGASRQVFQNAYRLRARETEAEKVLWNALKGKQLGVRFRRQHPIGSFIVDFYCHQRLLVIEVDGGYHNSKDQQQADEARTEELEASGLKVIRFSNELVINDLLGVVKEIRENL